MITRNEPLPPDSSIVERAPNGATAVTVLGSDSVDYYVTNAAGAIVWNMDVPNGPRAQRSRQAAALEQSRQFWTVSQ